MFQRILIATDGSTLSRKAVATGIALAAQHGA
ncbi:MAG TPA: universal stress protein, partial [Burkholderiaceae bacterium]